MMLQNNEGSRPQISFTVDANGRSVWTAAGSAKPAAEKKEAAPVAVASGDHQLSSVENTEAFLSKHGIKFKVSAQNFDQINMSRYRFL